MKKNAVTAAPTSTTNMTGLRACVRGLSLAKESPIARSTIWRSKSGRAFGRRSKRRLGRRCPLTGGSGRGCVIMLECLSLLQKQMLDDRSERVGRKERERADDDNRADQQGNEDRRMRCERADSGRDGFFPGERTGKCECRNGDSEAPEKHVHSGGHIPEEVRPNPAKALPLFALVDVNAYSISENPCTALFPSVERASGLITATAVGTRQSTGVTSTARIANCTSRRSIFLPRNSGVRPTMRPAMKTVSTTNSSIP